MSDECKHAYDLDGRCSRCGDDFGIEIERLRERVGELEQDERPIPGVFLSYDQIDKVWRYVNCNHSAQTWDAMLTVLAGFGISRCEPCSGDGVTAIDDVDGEYAEGPCSACDGHGWVIHDKD